MWCLSRECAPVICIADVPTEADERKRRLTTAALKAVRGGGEGWVCGGGVFYSISTPAQRLDAPQVITV